MNKQLASSELQSDIDNKEANINELAENIDKINFLTKKISGLLGKKIGSFDEGNTHFNKVNSDIFFKLASKYFSNLISNPNIVFESQVNYYKSFLEIYTNNFKNDYNFYKNKNIDFKNNSFFNMMSNNYDLIQNFIKYSINKVDNLNKKEKDQFNFLTSQLLDMFSPDNFLLTNSKALSTAIETNGKSLISGLNNFVNDLEKNDNRFEVSIVNEGAFKVGKNIAHTEGSVVFQNKLFQLIHYKPLLSKISQTPLLIVPPCINKYYNLDLQEKNSFVKFSLNQGIDVFMISWINADSSYQSTNFEDYIDLGILTASKMVTKITDSKKINGLGYCIGGTMLSVALSYLSKKNKNNFSSATFLTTLTDFEDIGDLSFFMSDDHICLLKKQILKDGFLSGESLAQTFNMLKSKDLFFKPAVRSYLLGEKPPAFDILYWNNDKTNLPAKMALEYLDIFYKNNLFSKGELILFKNKLSLSEIDIPIFVVSTEKDHIAPWKSSFKGLNKTSGEKTFVLAESGHIAGIINSPNSNKYGYKISDNFSDFDNNNLAINGNFGSWWSEWSQWTKSFSGSLKNSVTPGSNKNFPAIEEAPGSFVLKKNNYAVAESS